MGDSIIFQIGQVRTGQDWTGCLHFVLYNMPLEAWKCQKIHPDYKKVAKEDKDTYWNQHNSDPRRTPPAVNVGNRTAVSTTNTPHKWQLEGLCQCQSFLLMLKHSSWCKILSANEITSLILHYQEQEPKCLHFQSVLVRSKPSRDPFAEWQPVTGCETEMFFKVSITKGEKRQHFIHMFPLHTF